MSREVAEIQVIRREKENIRQLIRLYQERNKELNAKEEVLIRKMESARAREFDWRQLMREGQDSEGYVINESILGLSKFIETPEMKENRIAKLREEVLQKQYENMKLEKELENRKEEHRIFHDMLMKKKEVLGECLHSGCPTFFQEKKYSEEKHKSEGRVDNAMDNKFGNEVWDDMRNSLD